MNTRLIHTVRPGPIFYFGPLKRLTVKRLAVKRLTVLCLATCVLTAGAFAAETTEIVEKEVDLGNVVVHKDVVFGDYDPEALVLAAFVPKSEKPTPVYVLVNSGGWGSGPIRIKDGEEQTFVDRYREYFDAGLSVIAVCHRPVERDDVHWPAPMDDVARAIQYIRYRAGDWNLDPNRISIYGRSSGSQVAEMIAYSPDRADPDSDDPVERQSTRINCVIAYGGTSDLANHFDMILKTGPGGKPAVSKDYMAKHLNRLFGLGPEAVGTDVMKEHLRAMSPIHLLTKNSPPTLLVHAGPPDAKSKDDPRLAWEVHTAINGFMMAERMDELGVPHKIVLREGRGDPDKAKREIEFMKENGGI